MSSCQKDLLNSFAEIMQACSPVFTLKEKKSVFFIHHDQPKTSESKDFQFKFNIEKTSVQISGIF